MKTDLLNAKYPVAWHGVKLPAKLKLHLSVPPELLRALI